MASPFSDSGPPPPPPRPPIDRPAGPQPPRFQFSLKTQLWVVTGIAVLLGIGVSLPLKIVAIVVASVLAILPAALTTGLVYGRDDVRAFCIGGLFPAGVAVRGLYLGGMAGANRDMLGGLAGNLEGLLTMALTLIPVLVATIGSGFLCVWIRRVLIRRQSE